MSNKYNPASPIVEAIKKLTTTMGVVQDLHGNVFNPVTQLIPQTSKRGWHYLRIPTERPLSLNESYDKSVSIDNVETLPITDEGFADLSSIGASVNEREALLLVTGMAVKQPSSISISLSVKNSNITIFLNNLKLKEGFEELTLDNVMLQSNTVNTMQIIIWRRSQQYTLTGTIQLKTDSAVTLTPPVPDAARWDDNASIVFGSLDPLVRSDGLILQWNKSPFVGGWFVDRVSYQSLGVVDSVVTSGTTGFNFTLSGTHSPISNLPVLINTEYIGLTVDYEDLGGNQTRVNVLSSLVTSGNTWGSTKMFALKESSTIAEVEKRSSELDRDKVLYFDNDVVEGMPYSYTLYSWSALDKNLVGRESETITELAFDETAPGPITLYPNATDAISVDGDIISVQHIYPDDPDLAGYRIYGSSATTDLVVDLRRGNEFLSLENAVPTGGGSTPDRFGLMKFRAKEVEGFDVQNIVSGYIITTYDFAGNELAIASGTTVNFTLLVGLPENFTPFDNVSSPTETQRRPSTIPASLWTAAIDVLSANMHRAGYK